ncbi:alpha/beta hydrolase family protein [Sphingosinicella sp.]|uniref:alpha/beta hydrolase family protein n=1 Tax=Sphingosinicella sp. TaxID=1917971 RepID=UPI0040380245
MNSTAKTLKPGGLIVKRFAAALLALAAFPAHGQVDPAVAFGARENVEFIALSPDGQRVAYGIPRDGRGSRVMVLEIGQNQPRAVTSTESDGERIRRCDWVSNRRLLCSLHSLAGGAGMVASGIRLVAFDVDGSNVRSLASLGLWSDRVVDWLPDREDEVLLLLSGRRGYPFVSRVDTRSGRQTYVDSASTTPIDFLADGHGRIRIMRVQEVRGTDRAGRIVRSYYRTAQSDAWVPLGEYNQLSDRGPWPLSVDGDQVYVMEQNSDGRRTVYRMALDGSQRRDLTAENPRVDIEDVIRLGRRGRVIGVTYATERRQATYFDESLSRTAQQLSRALPGTPLIDFIGASDDEARLLIRAGSDVDPGTYYVLDRATRSLTRLMRGRPELDDVRLANVRAITYRAADGTEVPGYLTLPTGRPERGLPAIVMPHGGPSARDVWGFDWLAQYFAARGFVVLQPNFRGSSGYGYQWFQTNGFQSWRTAVGDINDAARWLVREGIADPQRLAVFGWSYGGYAALQSGVVEPGLFHAIVAIAPVTDLAQARDEYRWSWSSANVRDFFGAGPHIVEGSPARQASHINVPVLLFHGTLDLNVRIQQSRAMRDRLRDAGRTVELVEFPALDHYLMDSSARAQLLQRSDAFIRQALGIQP